MLLTSSLVIFIFFLFSGKRTFRIVDAFSGLQPLSIICCMVDSEAALGARDLNPYLLDHNNLSSLEVRSNQQVLYSLKIDWENNDCAEAYYNLFKNNFGHIPGQTPNISLDMFRRGFFLILVELSESVKLFSQSDVWTKINPGSVSISGTFSKPLNRSLDFIYCGFLYDCVQITSKRAVYLASSRFRETKSTIA